MTNCKQKVNPTDRFSALGRCLTCESQKVTLSYYWSLDVYDAANDAYLPISHLHMMAKETGNSNIWVNIIN